MEYRELVRSIPRAVRGDLSEKLMDVLLEVEDGSRVPSSLAKIILHYMQRDQLSSEAGLINLLKATVEADPVKTGGVLEEFDLKEIKIALMPT